MRKSNFLMFILAILLTLPFKLFSDDNIKQDIINKVKQSVVRVNVIYPPHIAFKSGFSKGSGYVIDKSGLIVTNHHIIEDAAGILIYKPGEDSSKPHYASVLWDNKKLDLAVLKAEDLDLPALSLADTNDILMGDEILILGYPVSGYKNKDIKVTWGIISSDVNDSTIQTTASINPGNSGGPAVNLEGKVVGTVYSKMIGLSIEATGFLRNNMFLARMIDQNGTFIGDTTSETEKKKKIYPGTDNFEAYGLLCDAGLKDENFYKADSLEDKFSAIKESQKLCIKAIDLDYKYAYAHYFLALYYLKEALLYCKDENDQKIEQLMIDFRNEMALSDKYDYKISEDEEFWDMVEGLIYEDNDVDCDYWNDISQKIELYEEARDKRLEDFFDYINTGKMPEILKETIENGEYTGNSRPEEKNVKYDPLIKGMPVAVNYVSYFAATGVFSDHSGTPFRTNQQMLGIEVQPFKNFKFLMDIYTYGIYITTKKPVDVIPVALGLNYKNIRVKYTFGNQNNMSIPNFIFEYMPGQPDIRRGIPDYYWWIGFSYYNNYVQSFGFRLGFDYHVYKYFWLGLDSNIGSAKYEQLQLGLSLGIRL